VFGLHSLSELDPSDQWMPDRKFYRTPGLRGLMLRSTDQGLIGGLLWRKFR
jgi:hypothetical protein